MDLSDVIRLLRDVKKAITRIARASGAIHEAAAELAALVERLESPVAGAVGGVTASPAVGMTLPLALAKLKVGLDRILPEPDNPSPKQWHNWP
jgi:hypothetical protein